MRQRWEQRARELRADVFALYLACRDRRVPWYAKVAAGLVVAYAVSPIDLIPDFIPVLGYLDDLLILPAGILLARRMIPAPLLAEHRVMAGERLHVGRRRDHRRDLARACGRRGAAHHVKAVAWPAA